VHSARMAAREQRNRRPGQRQHGHNRKNGKTCRDHDRLLQMRIAARTATARPECEVFLHAPALDAADQSAAVVNSSQALSNPPSTQLTSRIVELRPQPESRHHGHNAAQTRRSTQSATRAHQP